MNPKEAEEKLNSKLNKLNEELELKVIERTAQLENNIRQLKENEKKFQKAFDASAAGITITRLSDSTYQEVNDAFVQMTGYSKEELINRSSTEVGMIVSIQKREEVLLQVREHGSAKNVELTVRHKSGRILDVLSSVETILLNGEKHAINIIYDITERKKAEELFSNLFDHNPVSLAISRISDGKLIKVNESFLHLFGFSGTEEVVGKTAAELNIWVESNQRDEMLRLLKENNRVHNLEGQIRTPKDGPKWVSSSVIIIEVDNQPCLLAVTLDLTGRKKAEEQLQEVNKELESFSYSISHDLRAPLRSLIGYSKMLEEDYKEILDDDGKRILGVIEHNALKMNTLIDDLLEFSKLGRKELYKSEIDTEALIQGILSEMSSSAPHKAAIRLDPVPPTFADQALLKQVWINLISNAIKYSSRKANPEVEIGSRKEVNEIVFHVKDNGAGFDMQYASKLFGVFQRLHKATEYEGTGVGLALVHRIVARHGGRVWAEGKVNEGATFYFSLPK